MKKLFFLLAIASSMVTMACNNETKKKDAAETTPIVKAEDIDAQVKEYETLISESDEEQLSEVVDKRSYALGVSMGMAIKQINEVLELDIDFLKSNVLNFYLNGDYTSEEFMQDNQAFEQFMFTSYNNYYRVLQQRKSFEEGGVTEDLPELPELYTEDMTRDDVARILGNQFGASLKDVDNLNYAWLMRGFDDALAVEDMSTPEAINAGLIITTEEIGMTLSELQQEMMAKAQAKYKQMCEENKAASEKWLAKIAKQKGVKKTESGLLYRIERKGDGAYPTADTDVVEVNYEGTLQDGTVFDSSYERGETVSFPLNQVIKGWTEGLKLINEGGEITLWIPADLAYGERDMGTIKPNSALKFKVELIKVEK